MCLFPVTDIRKTHALDWLKVEKKNVSLLYLETGSWDSVLVGHFSKDSRVLPSFFQKLW